MTQLPSKTYASGKPFVGNEMALGIRQPDGETATRYLDFVYQPITDTAGKVTGIFVQGSDVTVRKLAQDEVRHYQSNLEALVLERTKALEDTQSALQRAQKLEAVGKLTGEIAHDFKAALNK